MVPSITENRPSTRATQPETEIGRLQKQRNRKLSSYVTEQYSGAHLEQTISCI